MTLDIPHMIATAVIIFMLVYGTNHMAMFEGMSKGKKALITGAILFIALFLLNLNWPYGAGTQ